MRNRRVACLATLALIFVRLPARAALGEPATAASQFLRIGAGGRALGMGEAYGPVTDGADAVYWNPAGLGRLRGPAVAFSHTEMMRYFHHDFLAYAHPIRPLGGVMALSGTVFYQDQVLALDNANQPIGNFQPHSEAFALAYAQNFLIHEEAPSSEIGNFRSFFKQVRRRGSREDESSWRGALSVGLSVKYIRETLFLRSAGAVAVDGGARYCPDSHDAFDLSLAFRNLGSKVRFIRENEKLPQEGAAGFAYNLRFDNGNRLTSAVEGILAGSSRASGRVGLEFSSFVGESSRTALRVGYKSLTATDLETLSGLTAGVGLDTGSFSVDFGFQPLGPLGQAYRLGLAKRF